MNKQTIINILKESYNKFEIDKEYGDVQELTYIINKQLGLLKLIKFYESM